MAEADRPNRSFVWPHLWWRGSLFQGEGLHKLRWQLYTLTPPPHTHIHPTHIPLHPSLSHCLCTSSPLLCFLSLHSQLLVTDPGSGWWCWHIVSSSLSPHSYFLIPTHSSTPTRGVIINTSPISIFHAVCLEKAREPGLGSVCSRERDAKKDL